MRKAAVILAALLFLGMLTGCGAEEGPCLRTSTIIIPIQTGTINNVPIYTYIPTETCVERGPVVK